MLSLKTEISFLAFFYMVYKIISFSVSYLSTWKTISKWQWNIHSLRIAKKEKKTTLEQNGKLFKLKMKNFVCLFFYFFIVSEIPHFITLSVFAISCAINDGFSISLTTKVFHLSNKVFSKWCKLIKKWKRN